MIIPINQHWAIPVSSFDTELYFSGKKCAFTRLQINPVPVCSAIAKATLKPVRCVVGDNPPVSISHNFNFFRKIFTENYEFIVPYMPRCQKSLL